MAGYLCRYCGSENRDHECLNFLFCEECKESYPEGTHFHNETKETHYEIPLTGLAGEMSNRLDIGNKLPEGQGKRDKICPRHDLIPLEFLDELAEIFEEGRKPRPGLPDGYGNSWKAGGKVFLRDCLNHASNHLHLYMNGDRSENHMSKVAWNCLVVRYHVLKETKEGK